MHYRASRDETKIEMTKAQWERLWSYHHLLGHLCKTRENLNFLKKGKTVISVKIQNFSRSRMTKWTSLLESSREI